MYIKGESTMKKRNTLRIAVLTILLLSAVVLLTLAVFAANDTRTEINKFVATTDMTVEYGETVRSAFNVTVEQGKEAYLASSMGRWWKKNGDEWENYNGTVFTDGTFRFSTQLRIDGANGTTHKLAPEVSVTVDGNTWTHEAVGVYDTYSYTFITSPEIVIEKKDIPLVFTDSYAFDIYRPYANREIEPYSLAGAVVGGSGDYVFSKTSGPEWVKVSADGTVSGKPTELYDGGTLIVRVTDGKGDYKEIKIDVTRVYLDPKDKAVVSKFTATAELTPTYGGKVNKAYDFSITEGKEIRVAASMGNWFKKYGDQWIRYDSASFVEGEYYFYTQLRIDNDSKYGETHRLGEDLKVTINGKEWTCDQVNVYEEYSYTFITSPSFTVEKPEITELIFWDDDALDIPESYAGTPIKSFSLANKVEGGLAPYVFSKKLGPAWINVSNDGTVSGTPDKKIDFNGSMTVEVCDLLGTKKQITIDVDRTYPSSESREDITQMTATSDMKTPLLNATVENNVSFTLTNDVNARFVGGDERGWYKKVGESWEKYSGETFDEGYFRYVNKIAVDGAYGKLYKFGDSVTVTVDGVEWAVEGLTTENGESYAFALSPIVYAHDHEYSTAKNDTLEHWLECRCGDKIDSTPHSDNSKDGKCDVCDYQMSTNEPDTEPNEEPDNNEAGQKPTEKVTEKSTNAPKATEKPTEPAKKKGCGSVIGVSSVVLVSLLGTALIVKKKD